MTVRVTTDFRILERLIRNCVGIPVRILHDGTEYGVHQEFGTVRHAAHPFMTPAIEHVRPAYNKGLKQLENLEQADAFVEKLGRDAETVAKANAPVDTGNLRNSIAVHKPEELPHIGWDAPKQEWVKQ